MSLAMRAVTAGFRRLAALRSARAFHPAGRLGRGTLVLTEPASALGAALGSGDHPVRLRLSRGAGLPGGLPDFLGVAVRVEREQPVDLLFTTSGWLPVLRWLIVPARRWTSRPYSTVLPYHEADGRVLLSLLPADDWLPDSSLETLAEVGEGHPLELDVLEGRWPGEWNLVGRLTVEALDEDGQLAFDPILNAADGLRPVSLLSDVREAAYRGSRAGREVASPVSAGTPS